MTTLTDTILKSYPTSLELLTNPPLTLSFTASPFPLISSNISYTLSTTECNQSRSFWWSNVLGPQFTVSWECKVTEDLPAVNADSFGFSWYRTLPTIYEADPANTPGFKLTHIFLANLQTVTLYSNSNVITTKTNAPKFDTSSYRSYTMNYNFGYVNAYCDGSNYLSFNIPDNVYSLYDPYSNSYFGFTARNGGATAIVNVRNIVITGNNSWSADKVYFEYDNVYAACNTYMLIGSNGTYGGNQPDARTSLPSTGGWLKYVPRVSLRNLVDSELYIHPVRKCITIHNSSDSNSFSNYSTYSYAQTYYIGDYTIHNGYFHICTTSNAAFGMTSIVPSNDPAVGFTNTATSYWVTKYAFNSTGTIAASNAAVFHQGTIYRARSNLVYSSNTLDTLYTPALNTTAWSNFGWLSVPYQDNTLLEYYKTGSNYSYFTFNDTSNEPVPKTTLTTGWIPIYDSNMSVYANEVYMNDKLAVYRAQDIIQPGISPSDNTYPSYWQKISFALNGPVNLSDLHGSVLNINESFLSSMNSMLSGSLALSAFRGCLFSKIMDTTN
jgi:hypothetical protein